jgi:hypothetical protein
MNPYNFCLLFFGFCAFFISLLIWLKREDFIGKIYFIFSTLVSIWAIGFAIMLRRDVSYSAALNSGRIAQASAIFVPVMWVHFVAVYVNKMERVVKLLKILYVLALIIENYERLSGAQVNWWRHHFC